MAKTTGKQRVDVERLVLKRTEVRLRAGEFFYEPEKTWTIQDKFGIKCAYPKRMVVGVFLYGEK